VLDCVLKSELHGGKEVVESHSAILLVLGGAQVLTALEDLSDDLLGRAGLFELSLLLAFTLSLCQLLEGDDSFIFSQIILL
jgi:hypothetical protein